MNQQEFSDVTQRYLCRFREILEDMIAGMTEAERKNSISYNFIVQMIPHHRAAIEMSKNLLQYTTCLPLQEIAQNIIGEQTKSIENMQKALGQCGRLQSSPKELREYQEAFQKITQEMFSQMREARADNNVNGNFMREMIPHHQGAIRMSENALQYAICPALRPILQAIITSQREGVCKMERLLRCTP